MLTLPERQALRALYDEAVAQLNESRPSISLTKGFYAETGDAIFDAGYLALFDSSVDSSPEARRLHVVSAPAGGGKTSFSYALMMAVTRLAEQDPHAPYGCIFVADQIKKADEVYRELNDLMPGKVAIWTTEHDRDCKPDNRKKVPVPAALFKQDELRCYPIVVVTHAFYNGPKGNKAQQMVRNGKHSSGRALVIVDERPEEVETYETTLKQAQDIREKLGTLRPDLQELMDGLMLSVLMPFSFSVPANVISKPTAEYNRDFFGKHMGWFNSRDAVQTENALAHEIPGIDQLFGYARALTTGCAFAVPNESVVRFVGWRSKFIVRPGTLLLDATADIDGVTQVCPWRVHAKVPKAHYSNLSIVHVPQHTRTRLSEYLKTAANQRAYVEWMVATIKEHMAPGEKGLVVCKKVLFDAERVPNWGEGDDWFKTPATYTEGYGWNIEGRELCAIHWGTGVGSNAWQEADVVFLLDEFFIPRRIAVATIQGLREHRADEGDLGKMTTLNSKARGVDLIADGHRLRWTKQLALRGRGRSYDQQGNCGKQRLVVSSDLGRFMASAERLFPGASIKTVARSSEENTWAERALQALSRPKELPTVLRTKDLARILGKPWRAISSNVLTPQFQSGLSALGWAYVSTRGRGGSRFVRTEQTTSITAFGAPERHTGPCEPALSVPVEPSGAAIA